VLFTCNNFKSSSGPGKKNYKAVLECLSLSDAFQQKLIISDNKSGFVQSINVKLLNPATDPLKNE
jgi:hypothetical protein